MFSRKAWQRAYEPSHEVLRQLNHLGRSPPNFPDQLTSIFSTEEYKNLDTLRDLKSKDRAWLIEHLDNVCVCDSLHLLPTDLA